MKNPEQIKIVAKVTCNDGFAYVLNRMPHFLYTKLDWKTIIGQDEAMYRFYMYEDWGDKHKAFGGRHFQLELTDGTVEDCHGQWWDGMNNTSRKLYNPDNLRYFAYSTIEELRKCYVYTGCYADFEWIRKLDIEYDGEIYDYWKFEEMIENIKIFEL